MRAKQLFSRLVTVVTLLVAAFIFAPSGAQAHAGHSHAVPAVRVTEAVVKANLAGANWSLRRSPTMLRR